VKYGFTGSQSGMTWEQKVEFVRRILHTEWSEFHHGNCIGSDEDAGLIVMALKRPGQRVIAHPCTITLLQSQKATADEYLETYPPLIRNVHIVEVTDELIATPNGKERRRSGTWHTIRQARKRERKIYVLGE